MIVAFDFDGVVDNRKIQNLIKKMLAAKNQIWVITARRDDKYNREIVESVLSKVGLAKSSVIYAGNKKKIEFIDAINADIYIDNITNELEEINMYTNTIALHFDNK